MSNNEDSHVTVDELKKQVEEFQILFDSIPIMLWYKDKNNRHIRVNKAAADLEGLSPSQINGKSAYDMYPKEQATAFHKDDLQVITTGQPKLNIVEQHTSPKTGKLVWLQTGKVPYKDKDDQIIGAIAFAVDITEQKQAESALREAHDKLEERNRQLGRLTEFFGSTLEQMSTSVQHGADAEELLRYIKEAQEQFEKLG